MCLAQSVRIRRVKRLIRSFFHPSEPGRSEKTSHFLPVDTFRLPAGGVPLLRAPVPPEAVRRPSAHQVLPPARRKVRAWPTGGPRGVGEEALSREGRNGLELGSSGSPVRRRRLTRSSTWNASAGPLNRNASRVASRGRTLAPGLPSALSSSAALLADGRHAHAQLRGQSGMCGNAHPFGLLSLSLSPTSSFL